MKRLLPLLLALMLTGCAARPPLAPSGSPEPAPPPAEVSLPSSLPAEELPEEPPPEAPSEPPAVFQPEQPAPEVADPLDEVGEPEGTPEPEQPPEDSEAAPSAPEDGETRTFWEIREEMVENAAAFREENPDTVGWLYLYETTIDSPVFQREDNTYYLKHNDYRQEDVNGAIVSDCRNRLTGRDSQSQNLVLYAHSKDENPDGGVEASREFEHFTELKRYQDKNFCLAHPYFLFATGEESMVFEIFAAFHTKTSFVYNIPNPSRSQMEAILAEAEKKSLFDFGVEVTADDRIMTLSTCCRRIVPTYPNGYRFVLMGRLVEKGRVLNYDDRTVTENPTALAPWNVYE